MPWMLVEAGTAWFWCAVLPAVLAVARFWIKSGTKTGIWVKTGVSLLALLAAWNVFVVGAHGMNRNYGFCWGPEF